MIISCAWILAIAQNGGKPWGRRGQPNGVHCGAGEGHDILSRILHQAVHHAGVAPALEPPLQRSPGLEAGATATGESFSQLGARGGLLVAQEAGMTVATRGRCVVTRPPVVALRAASAATDVVGSD
jgi:hypothetical protein